MNKLSLKPVRFSKLFLLGVAEAVLLYIPVAIIAVLIAGLVGIMFGFNVFGQTTKFQDAQLVLWLGIALAFLCYVVQRYLRNRQTDTMIALRWLCLVSIPVLLVGGILGSVGLFVSATRAPKGCDMTSTLDTAISSTYPIMAEKTDASEYGSGFAIDGKGTIVTAYHVVQDAKQVYINFQSGRQPLTIVRTSPADDLALLKYSKPTPSYINLSDNPALGEDTYALGYPGNAFFVGEASLTKGIVSRTITNDDVRSIAGNAPIELSFVQTDAAINPGNSGGPLINKCGVIGVVDKISDSENLHQYGLGVSEQNISYAINSSTLKAAFGL